MRSEWSLFVLGIFALFLVQGVSAAVIQSTTIDGYYTVVKFTGSGDIDWTVPYGVDSVDYLVIAGGGSGGAGYGGGGGAGGVLAGTAFKVTPREVYNITVGAGGVAQSYEHGFVGTNSTFKNATYIITSAGGGYGGAGSAPFGPDGGPGGSGGGAGGKAGTTEYAGGANTTGQGFYGGSKLAAAGYNYFPSAGGGGAGNRGYNTSGDIYGANGGPGISSSITGTATWYAGGGGGCSETNVGYGVGGIGGGGEGSRGAVDGTAGTDGLGGGGGGANWPYAHGGKGGDGVVIVRYLTRPTTWTYTTPGTYSWVQSDYPYATNLYVRIVGAGGSGKGAYNAGGYKSGYGGSAGGYNSYSNVRMTSGATYTIVVGAGGAISMPDTVSNNGTASSITGTGVSYSEAGGIGGLSTPQFVGNGGNGVDGFINTTKYAVNGGDASPYIGGIAGAGYGAGGGGGASIPTVGGTYGGPGANGTVMLTLLEASEGNSPDFAASQTSSSTGAIITFTDLSSIRNNQNMTYLWQFGDGTTSSTIGSVNHIYGLYGVYTVNLTITSDSGTVLTNKANYITISQPSYPTTYYTQKTVRFKAISYGAPLVGALISVNYVNTSLPNTDINWLTSAFGISATVAQQMTNGSLAMQGYTGSDGSNSFMMFPALQYGITITNASAGISKYVVLSPQDTDYIIDCSPSTTPPVGLQRIEQLVNSTLYITEPNASWIVWNLQYQDTSGYTTHLTWNVTCWNNQTVMYSKTWATVGTGVVTDSYTFPSVPSGVEFRAIYDATRVRP